MTEDQLRDYMHKQRGVLGGAMIGPGFNPAAQLQEQRPISESESALKRLNALIDQSQASLKRLQSRLDAVTRPTPERGGNAMGSGQTAPTPVRCQLVNNIESAGDRIAALNDDIEALTGAVGI